MNRQYMSLKSTGEGYRAFKPRDRFRLAMKAKLRGDEQEFRRFIDTCPRKTYSQLDAEFADLLEASRTAAWDFLHQWTGTLAARQYGIQEVLDAASRVLDSSSLEKLRATMEYTRESVARYPEFVAESALPEAQRMARLVARMDAEAEGREPHFGHFIPEAYLASPGPTPQPSGYTQVVQFLRAIVEGFRRYAGQAGLTIPEALAPLPEPVRNRLLPQIDDLPKIPWNEELAHCYFLRLVPDKVFAQAVREAPERIPDYEEAANCVAQDMPCLDNSDVTRFEKYIRWHREHMDALMRLPLG